MTDPDDLLDHRFRMADPGYHYDNDLEDNTVKRTKLGWMLRHMARTDASWGEAADAYEREVGDGKGLARWCVASLLIVVVCVALVWGW